MAVDNHQAAIYEKIWELILNDSDFKTVAGISVGPNNRIRVDSGKVNPTKKTAAQDGDLPELEIRIGEMTDLGNPGEDDQTRPTFDLVEGGNSDDPHVIPYEYVMYLTYPTQRFSDYFPLLEVIRRNLRGYKLRKAGLTYCGNTSVTATFEKEAEWRDTKRPQHVITVTVDVHKN